jgi:four helix bundle protein
MPTFDHEKLEAYQLAIDFVVAADGLVGSLPRGRAHLADQFHRAATSIPLNIAEGAGEFSPQDKARFYRIALRSATECAALLDVGTRLALCDESKAGKAREVLVRIVSMLTKLALRHGGTGTGSGTGSGTGTGTGNRASRSTRSNP